MKMGDPFARSSSRSAGENGCQGMPPVSPSREEREGFAGALAAHLDAGALPADAWVATTRELAVDPA